MSSKTETGGCNDLETDPGDGVVSRGVTNMDRRPDRRTFLKGLGASAAGVFALGSDYGPVREAEAIAPLVAVGVVGASAGVGWALREFEVIGSDPVPEGLTASALENQINQASTVRESENASTFVDNQNILKGMENVAYTEAKIAAIEKLNEGETQTNVLAAANGAIDTYHTTVVKNLLKSWNASVSELNNLKSAAVSHSEVSDDFVKFSAPNLLNYETQDFNAQASTTVTLPDGSDFTLKQVESTLGTTDAETGPDGPYTNLNVTATYSPVGKGYPSQYDPAFVVAGDTEYMLYTEWSGLYGEINNTFDNVRDGISTWVTSVYGDVQSGSIKVSDLVTPRERAAMMSDGEGGSQAIADLIALNVPVDLEREATIVHGSTGATLRGSFGLTDESDGPLVAGETYNADTFSGDVYFSTDLSLMEGSWSEINTGVDGGVITITSEPYEGTEIQVTTVAGETVSVPAADWSDGGDGTWTYDASDDLETAITDVDSARFVSSSDEANYETLNLSGSFTVESITNTETGEDVSETSFTSSEPQTDSNYITQEEWDDMAAKNEELIQKYEDSQSNGGGLDLSGLDMFGMPGELVALAAAAVAFLFASK